MVTGVFLMGSGGAYRRAAAVVAVAALALLPALAGASRLSYHEAIWAQSARELLSRTDADWLVPTLDGRPWLEKPPLPTWPIAALGWGLGGVDVWVARVPSVVAAVGLALAVSALATRRYGSAVGLLAGLVQATTAWTVARGRLAEADIVLAALVAGTMAAFDRFRGKDDWVGRWAFFGLLGLTGLAKGIGFGAVLIGSAVLSVLVWDRDWGTFRRLLRSPGGWALAAVMMLAWPVWVVAQLPEVLGLWVGHVAGRFASRPGTFAGESWWEYGPAFLVLLLPWTPLALAGAWRSWRGVGGPDRLLWAWAVVPAVLVSLARARNSHYLLPALAPWSIWSALALARFGERLRGWGWTTPGLRRLMLLAFLGLGVAYGVGYAALGPRLDRRGREWAFYEEVGRRVPAAEPLVLLYDDWDRLPYPTPFGPMPHDLAVRLFHLGRPALWRASPEALRADAPPGAFAVLARDRDMPELASLGRVELLARGPLLRAPASRVDDRAFVLFRVTPEEAVLVQVVP